MMKIQLEGMEKIQEALEGFNDMALDALEGVLKTKLAQIQAAARENAPSETGRLRNSIVAQTTRQEGGIHGVVKATAPYAAAVEMGTGPENEASQRGYTQGRLGRAPKPYLYPALVAIKPTIVPDMIQALKKMR